MSPSLIEQQSPQRIVTGPMQKLRVELKYGSIGLKKEKFGTPCGVSLKQYECRSAEAGEVWYDVRQLDPVNAP